MRRLTRHLLAIICLSAGSIASSADLSTIRFATEAGYPPFEFVAPNGEIQGFNIDIGNEICKRLEAECTWLDQSFDSLIPGLQARKFDLANSTMTATDARRRVIDFSHPLYIVASRLVTHKNNNLEPTVESLKGLRIGVQQGTTMETYARKEWAPKGIQIIAYPSYTNAYTDLAAGRIDASFQEAANAVDGFLNKPEGADYHLSGSTIKDSATLNEPIALGIRKGNKNLKQQVDATIQTMLADGTIQKLSEKYFESGTIDFPSTH